MIWYFVTVSLRRSCIFPVAGSGFYGSCQNETVARKGAFPARSMGGFIQLGTDFYGRLDDAVADGVVHELHDRVGVQLLHY